MEDALTIGGAVAIALALVEAVKIALLKAIDGKSVDTQYVVGKAEWRTRLEQMISQQHEMQKEILQLQRATIQLLEMVSNKE